MTKDEAKALTIGREYDVTLRDGGVVRGTLEGIVPLRTYTHGKPGTCDGLSVTGKADGHKWEARIELADVVSAQQAKGDCPACETGEAGKAKTTPTATPAAKAPAIDAKPAILKK